MNQKIFLFCFSAFVGIQLSSAQCSHDPVITGNTILCPNDSSVLSTQAYDSYQWYKREWMSGNPFTAISGANQQTHSVYENADLLYEFVVEATLAGCTEPSDTILIDGHVFMLPYAAETATPGTSQYNPNTGETEVCSGYTVLLEGNDPPYSTYTWYMNGSVINGVTTNTYTVSSDGTYTFGACTGICPNYCQPLGVSMTYVFGNWSFCPVNNIEKINEINELIIYPNPAKDILNIELPENGDVIITILDMTGKIIKMIHSSGARQIVNITELPAGIYNLIAVINDRNYSYMISKTE